MSETQYFDEMWGHDETLRQPYRQFHDWLHRETPADLRAKIDRRLEAVG